MPAYKTKAISLKTAPFAEADKMITLFSRDLGKVKAIAKGARRVPSRLGGRVETFSYADYYIAKGRSLDIISQCEMIETFQGLRDDQEALPIGLYLLKLVNCGTVEGQSNPELFDLLLASLLRLKQKEAPGQVERNFELSFLQLEGIYREGLEPKYCLSEHVGLDLRRW